MYLQSVYVLVLQYAVSGDSEIDLLCTLPYIRMRTSTTLSSPSISRFLQMSPGNIATPVHLHACCILPHNLPNRAPSWWIFTNRYQFNSLSFRPGVSHTFPPRCCSPLETFISCSLYNAYIKINISYIGNKSNISINQNNNTIKFFLCCFLGYKWALIF